jgi:spermidine synthase
MKKILLELTVFTSGAVVMIYEIVGSRILGPYIGTSIFVWTSLIGIILASLSLGYWLGGRMADRKPSYRQLVWIIILATFFVWLTLTTKEYLLGLMSRHLIGIRTQAVLSTIILFAPASVFLGMVTPYAVRLKIRDIKSSGRTVGNLYAISTIGSIIGTFMAGFVLIPFLGSTNILFLIAAMLLIVAMIIVISRKLSSITYVGAILLAFLGYQAYNYNHTELNYLDIDTQYNRVFVYETSDWYTGKPIKLMRINNEYSSAMFLDSDSLVFPYSRYFRLIEHFNPGFNKVLILGGAGYSYPKYFLQNYPKAYIDVIEIDPMITEIARKEFNLRDNPRLRIFHDDARVFINRTEEKYDAILGDAFKSLYTIPFQLTTLEATERMYSMLNEGGLVIQNLHASLSGKNSYFLKIIFNTYQEVFPQVYLFRVHKERENEDIQSVILVALKSQTKPKFQNNDPELDAYLALRLENPSVEGLPVLTDEYAPVEHYVGSTLW